MFDETIRSKMRVRLFSPIQIPFNRSRLVPRLAKICGIHFGLICLLLNPACSKQKPAEAASTGPTSLKPSDSNRLSNTGAFEGSLPQTGGPAGYLGSASCRECHPEQFVSWHKSYHRTMTQLATGDSVQADFNHVVLTNDNTRFTLTRTNQEFWVRLEHLEGEGPSTFADVRLGIVTGSHHMQVFWLPSGQGNAQIGFPFTWLIPERRWVPRDATFIRPETAGHRSEVWNLVCCRCHATGVEPRINGAAHTAETYVGELGIACEACHGPGRRHVEARRAEPDKSTVDPALLAGEIIHPKKITPERASQICGFCHSMKWFDQSENWRDHGFRYRPGDDLEQTTPIIRPGHVQQIAGLQEYLQRNPDLLNDFFWPDGMIRVSGRDYNGLIESPCYKGGHFSCLSCHSLHKSDPDAQLARRQSPAAACTQCHDKFLDPAHVTAHTHHSADSTGSDCYNCHMPRTTYGVLKAIRSHQVSSPNVATQLATGRPNACNLCHLDKPLSWTSDQLSSWYGQAKPELSRTQTEVAESARLAFSGDAGQRALIAWHCGWQPALDASGRDWIPVVLGAMLDDSYAAVRCIAERSLKAIGSPPPPGYDFTITPANRAPLRAAVWEQWAGRMRSAQKSSWPPATGVNADLARVEEFFEQLSRNRDDHFVRFRE